ncbi:cytochrome b5 reductase 4 [Ischnura elegans]|uniref:cytochrome b5 reductase 4 n=1 Tax=Ischnura elegans TaxID=197161 RepID=UPI001ED89FE3|nr:cytochrome b5 reductase 4 [Ischnura elegans]
MATKMHKSPVTARKEPLLKTKPPGDQPSPLKATGSSTGTIRNKVALQPGHSLLDWIKLGHSGKDLTGVGGVYQTVTLDELSRHNKRDDAWIAIKGQVYNVTHYMDFHPGGHEELLRGVGMDATKLFNEVHAWVNVESMLQKCLVGRLKASKGDSRIQRSKESLSYLLFSKNKKNDNSADKGKSETQENPFQSSKVSGLPSPLLDCFQKPESFSILIYTKRPGRGDRTPSVCVCLKEECNLEVKLRIVKNGIFFSCTLPISLRAPVLWPCSLTLVPDIGKVEILLQKKIPQIWHDVVNPRTLRPEDVICKPLSDLNNSMEQDESGLEGKSCEYQLLYQPMKVMDIMVINHDTKLFVLKHVNNICEIIPIGYHVLLKATVEGETVERNYTPVNPALHSDFWPPSVPSKNNTIGPLPPDMEGNWLCLLIKSTEGGVLSPWLCDGGLSVGDTLMVSECIAPTIARDEPMYPPPFHMGKSPVLERSSEGIELLLLAAGTGITPMVRIILWALRIPSSQCKKITLLFFNKTEKDIIWREQLDKLMEDCDRFTAKYILSNASSGWKEDTGIIRSDLLEPYFTQTDGNLPSHEKRSCIFTCMCGPIPFTRTSEKILNDFGVKPQDFYSFLG